MIHAIRIKLANGETLYWNFKFSTNGTMRLDKSYILKGAADWVRLDHYQCPACTLDPAETPVCPVAEVMAKYAFDLADRQSEELVGVEIKLDDGSEYVLSDIPLQRVVGELVRMGAFQYECPIGRKVKKSMTELSPFPTNDEILAAFNRVFSESDELAGLTERELGVMEDLHDLFGNLAIRLDQVGRGDAHLNGVLILHSLSVLFSLSVPEVISKVSECKERID